MGNYFNLIICLFILIFPLINIVCSSKLSPRYNFGNHQNPEIDKLYKHLKGKNLYFIKDGQGKTMYTIIIYPEDNLKIGLKMYTDSEEIISSLDKGKKIYFGIDFYINNTDISLSDYNTDIVICYFDTNDANCNDYIYDLNDGLYKINKNGEISNNNLIPIGFELTELNLLKENVMEYQNYYCVDFIKNFTENFDHVTMLNYFLYSASVMNRNVIAFYGVAESENELNVLNADQMLFYKQVKFIDGIGLSNHSFSIYNNKIFKSFLILIILFFNLI
jgi:hypothetical protein